MSPADFRAALARLNMTHVQAAAALGKGLRTIERYAAQGAPKTVELALGQLKPRKS